MLTCSCGLMVAELEEYRKHVSDTGHSLVINKALFICHLKRSHNNCQHCNHDNCKYCVECIDFNKAYNDGIMMSLKDTPSERELELSRINDLSLDDLLNELIRNSAGHIEEYYGSGRANCGELEKAYNKRLSILITGLDKMSFENEDCLSCHLHKEASNYTDRAMKTPHTCRVKCLSRDGE